MAAYPAWRRSAALQAALDIVLGSPKVLKTPEGTVQVEHKIGPGGVLKLQWPHYFDPVLSDVTAATTAASHAKIGGLIDEEHASKFVAEYFGVEDVQAMLKKIEAEKKDREEQMEMAMGGRAALGMGGGGPPRY